MRNRGGVAVFALALAAPALVVLGCATEPAPTDTGRGDTGGELATQSDGSGEGAAIAFSMTPDPPMAGENTFEVTVLDAEGQPVTDAEVSTRFHMAAMPEVNMPEMQNTTTLTHETGGRYRGTGQVIMAGEWEVTVTATRGGEEIARHTLTVTAQ